MKQVISLAIALMLMLSANAQNYGSLLLDKVNKAQQDNKLTSVTLFTKAERNADTFIKDYQAYLPITQNIHTLYTEKTAAISMTLYAADGKSYTLELTESHPTPADATINYMDEGGLHTTPQETGLHYQGIVKGAKKSLAAMSVFANGEIMMLFSNDDGNFNMGKLENNSGKYILYNTTDRLEELSFNCTTPDKGKIDIGGRSADKTTGAIGCKKLRIHWECDYTFYQSKGTLTATQNYLIGLFNFMQSIYYNEGMAIELSSLKIWTTDDPFTPTNAWDASWLFGRYWQSQKHTYYGVQPHLIANFTGWQGYANIGAICIPNGYACSNILGQQSSTYPVFDVDVYLVSHETGHTVGADHTQSCAWNTGPNGTCGSVDNCVAQYGGGCGTCFYLNDANASNFKGTIMSYCGGKINFSEGFGTVVGNFMRTEFNKHICFSGVISPELLTQNICNNDGSVTLNYNSNNFGVAPYTYSWSNSAITKDISGLASPGKYTVSIVDSNNCSTTAEATIINYSKPGDGNTLPGAMPYCCKDTSFDVTINASLPTNLTLCQTVAWLRTTQPIATYSDAKAAYTNASSNDLLLSDNDTSINNTTAAQLTISSPQACDSITSYYYTPFVARKPTQGKTYTTNATNPVTIKNGNFNLGTSMTIPAEPNLPAACETNSISVSDTITVTITNYTGRANNLTIRIISADNEELYQNITLPGDGVYQIPVSTHNHFQEMTVKAFDFNCSLGNTCTASSLTMAAERSVTYDALPALTLDSSCVAGTSVQLSFGPDNCNVGIQDIIQHLSNVYLYPNPATSSTILSFYADKPGSASISISNILGKVVQQQSINYHNGRNHVELYTAPYNSGVYFVHLQPEHSQSTSVKLLVK